MAFRTALALALGAIGALPGAALAIASGLTARLRRSKPLHPTGVVGDGTLSIDGSAASGVALLDDPGDHAVHLRWSRAIGWSSSAADIEGLALRWRLEGGPADLLFASTGSGKLTRHILLPRRPRVHGTLSTLLPVAAAGAPLLLRLEPSGAPRELTSPPSAYTLSWSRPGRPWQHIGEVTIHWGSSDEPTRFDPVIHELPGTTQYSIVRSLREPAYWSARRAHARMLRIGRG